MTRKELPTEIALNLDLPGWAELLRSEEEIPQQEGVLYLGKVIKLRSHGRQTARWRQLRRGSRESRDSVPLFAHVARRTARPGECRIQLGLVLSITALNVESRTLAAGW